MTPTGKTNGKDRILQALPKLAALLLRADDVDEAMNKALALLRRAVDVSRVYIFSNRENLEGQLLTSRRWEWVKKGVASQIQNPKLQNLSYEEAGFSRWVKLLSAGKAVFGPIESFPESERDLLKAQDILSLAVVPIVTADIWWGLIGFDDCSSSREWSKSEIDVLLTAAELIGAALERLHVERQLRYWNEFNRNIVESTSVGVLVVDKNARIQVWNGGMEGQFGVDAAEVLGEDIFRVFPVLAEEELGRILRHCIDEEEGFSENRLTHQTRHKGERILDVKVTPLRDIDEQFNGLVVIISDATARHEAEQALAESEEMYRALTESALMGVYIYREGRFLFVNERMAKITGYSVEELVEISTGDIVASDDRERLAKKVELIKSGKDKSSHYTFKIARKDGSEGYMEVYTRRIMYHGKEASIGHCLDISHRLKAQEALRASEERYRSTIQSMGDMIHVLNRDMRIVMYNQPLKQWTAELGLELGEVIDKTLFEVFPFLPEKVKQEYDEVWRTGKPLITTETTVLAGQSIITETRKIPVIDKEGNVERIVTVVRDITERKRAEEALLKEKGFSESVIASLPGIFYLFDEKGRLLQWNENFEKISGYSNEEIAKMSVFDFFAGEDRKIMEERVGEVFARGESTAEAEFVTKSGKRIPYFFTGLRTEIDDAVYLVGMGVDITERKRAEEALAESEERFRSIFETAQDSIFIKNRALRYIHVNPAMEKLFGLPASELIGRTDEDLFGAEAGAHVREADSRILNGEFVEEEHTKPVGGIPFTFHVVKVPMRDSSGEIIGLCGIARDITERKQAEEALAESEERLRSVVQTANDAIVSVNSRGEIVSWNQAGEAIFGYSADEILGKSLTAIMPERHRKEHQEAFERAISAGRFKYVGRVLETVGLKKDGEEFPVEFSMANWRAADELFFTIILRDITKRKLAQEAIVKAKEDWERTFDAVPDLITIMDGHFRIVRVNKAMADRLGVMPEECRGQTCFERIHGTNEPPSFCPHARLLKDGQEHIEEVYEERLGGDFLVTVSPLFDSQKQVIGSVHVARDITERKRVQEALAESEERYRTLQENIPVGIFRTSPQGEFLSANRALVNMLGFKSDEEMVNVSVADVYVCPEQRQEYVKLMNEEGMVADFEAQLRRKDGSVFWGSLNARAVSGEQGKSVHYDGILEDITERKRAEEALKESEERFRQMAELLPQTVYEIDLESNVTYANRFGLELFGYTQADIDKGPNSLDLFIPEDRERTRHHIERLLEGGKPYGEEYTVLRKDGSTFTAVMYSSLIIREGKPAGLRGVLVDITERKQASEQIKAALREKEVLLKEIHHRVKNNLQVIESLLSLQAEYLKDEKALAIFKNSRSRIAAMALVHEKLYQSHDLARINFGAYIRDLTNSLFTSYALAPDTVTLGMDIGDVVLDIDTSIPLALIINELVTNSLLHAFPQGRKGQIRIDLHADDDNDLTLVFTDDGVGLPEAIDIHNTETLGLQLVSLLVKQLRGNIELDRSNGTRFEIVFKRTEEKP